MTEHAAGHHRCPRPGCVVDVPDYLFACRDDWWTLPGEVRRAITATRNVPLPDAARTDAVARALAAWHDAAPDEGRR